jgi:3-deoxy-manno-octulosonate cytidylyltransferase (CMP-KDO synthetase)
MIETLAVIPARYASTRLPGKPLVKLCGKELALWVWEGARRSTSVDRLIVATDCDAIVDLVEKAGGEAMMTPAELPTGNDRVAYVADRIPSRFVLDIQGDDPTVSPQVIDPMVDALRRDPQVTLVVPVKRMGPDEAERSSVSKVVFDERRRALYFSRSLIPFSKDPKTVRFKHIGHYGWRREALFEFASHPQTPLEKLESLEMLRVLEMGGIISCVETDIDAIEINTPEDVIRFESFISEGFIGT